MWAANALCGVGFMTLLPLINTLVSNVSPADRRGLVNGLASTCGNLMRSAGPVLVGASFTASAKAGLTPIPFVFLAGTYGVTLLLSFGLPPEVEEASMDG